MSRTEHPSNRLYNGEVRDFLEALDLVHQEFVYERALMRRGIGATEDEIRSMDESHEQVEAALRYASCIYRAQMEQARQTMVGLLRHAARGEEGLQTLGEEAREWLGLLADAFQADDYRGLAI
jgi:hypothetical protein